MTIMNRMKEFIKENPNATNLEIAEKLNTDEKNIKQYIYRLKKRDELIEEKYEDKRVLTLTRKEPSKKDGIIEIMIDTFVEDFLNTDDVKLRIEISKEILKLLKK